MGAGLIYWLVQKGHLDSADLTRALNPTLIFTALTVILFQFVINTVRWQKLLETCHIKEKFAPLFRLNMIANFLNVTVPGGIGGDVVRAIYFSRRQPASKKDAALSVLVDRLMGFTVMCSMSAIALLAIFPVMLENRKLLFAFLIMFGLLTALICTLTASVNLNFANFFKRIVPFEKIKNRVVPQPLMAKFLPLGFFMSLVGQLGYIILFMQAARLTGENVNVMALFALVPIIIMVQSLPIVPAGFGVAQAAAIYIMGTDSGQNLSFGAVAITSVQIIQLVLAGIGALVFVFHKSRLKETPA